MGWIALIIVVLVLFLVLFINYRVSELNSKYDKWLEEMENGNKARITKKP